MKLSEAIVLGSTMITFDPSLYLGTGCGCFIGMGATALGKTTGYLVTAEFLFNFPEYPWLLEEFYPPSNLSLKCGPLRAHSIIGVMARQTKRGAYTFEQAIDWIRSVEPHEEQTEEAQKSEKAVSV